MAIVTKSAGSGSGWNSSTNIYTANAVYADSGNLDYEAQSANLVAKTFAFNADPNQLPSGATVNGVEVKVKGYGAVGMMALYAQLIIAGTPTGNIQNTYLPVSNGVVTLGGSADKWGTSLNATQARDSANFGVRVYAINDSEDDDTAYIDHIEIVIHYTPSSQSVAKELILKYDIRNLVAKSVILKYNIYSLYQAQFCRPAGDELITHWEDHNRGGANLYQKVDEEVVDNNDFIRSHWSPEDYVAVFLLNSVANPGVTTLHKLRFAHAAGDDQGLGWSYDGTENIDWTVEIRKGYVDETTKGTLVASREITSTSRDIVESEFLLTMSEATLIAGDYSDLYVRIVGVAA